jgi:hypothetical protein
MTTTKIDISSLDNYTKDRIAKLSARTKELVSGLEVEIAVPSIKVDVNWDEGTECSGPYIDNESIDWDAVEKQRSAIEQRINAEIKDICDFSDYCADRLNVDHFEFFDQYFLC